MLLPSTDAREGALEKRMDRNNKSFLIIAIMVISVFAILVITYLLTAKFRKPHSATRAATQDNNNKLPSLFSWKNLRKRPRRNDYSTSLQDTEYRGNGGTTGSREMSGAANGPVSSEAQNRNTTAGGVDRNTSVRSVMTLPAYAPAARADERVLGREGERAGMDNVIELPEAADDEELRREEEMESLYQIRLARRVEATDREARRQARRDARARGDVQALADIRRRAEEAADLSVSQMLIAEHQANARNRDRRVSSVAYGDLGVARHDGTRLRANSSESDNRPLLDSAASISGQSAHSRAYSNNTLNLETHQRGLSVTSFESRASSDYDFVDPIRTGTHSHQSPNTSDDFQVVSLNPGSSSSMSLAATPNADVPTDRAPAYEDPPTYESPIQTRSPQLPGIERLPSIQVTPDLAGDGRVRTAAAGQ
ncbi:hypothetical protein GQ44DRAFT_623510 [Phaeosphaeriaceae sp. PMI808]|nr:hypothetical protein GQ44DRAFT_623510 [Phaeosphaeriaceae sp. PMI808]